MNSARREANGMTAGARKTPGSTRPAGASPIAITLREPQWPNQARKKRRFCATAAAPYNRKLPICRPRSSASCESA